MWVYPYEETVGPSIRASLDLLYGKGKARFASLKDGAPALGKMTGRIGANLFKK